MSMSKSMDIRLYNRTTNRIEVERVYGRTVMDLFYGTRPGRWITSTLLCRRWISRLYGRFQDHPLSKRQIAPFIRQYHVDLDQVEIPPKGFTSFNSFFIRRLKADARPIDARPDRLIAPADSRLQIFPIEPDLTLNIKGLWTTLPQLLGTAHVSDRFQGGLCLCFRLAPCDYHRFGYAAEGNQGPVHTIDGPLHSVSPLALRHYKNVLSTNVRQWCFIQSLDLGTLVQIEVGAMMVGSIVQQQPRGGPCRRGQEKGYFQFGGSTVLLIIEPGRVHIDDNIMEWSVKGIETLVSYGESIGTIQ